MKFKSFFADSILSFLDEKRAMGYKYTTQERNLLSFDSFLASKYPDAQSLDKTVLFDWCTPRAGEHPKTLEGRVVPVREFCKYLRQTGVEAYEIPKGMLPHCPRYQPYIYSSDEIKRIIRQADCMEKARGSRYRHLVIPALLRILYGCGLRIGEACTLKSGDVDLEQGIITIKNGKLGKDRLVPVSPSLLEYLKSYKENIPLLFDEESWFFPSKHGRHFSCNAVNENFHELLWKAGIRDCGHDNTGRHSGGPRLHDFRHTFAVRCMKRWVLEGKDIRACLPVLQAYLGHASIKETAYYLHLTADLFPDIICKVEDVFRDVIPGGEQNETN